MATEVLLMADVSGLGVEGDVVTVADGFARNYLLPRNMAASVTKATRRRLAKMQGERNEQREVALAESNALAKQVAATSCTITVKVGEGDRMYGSVTEADIVEALKGQNIEIDRHQIVMPEPVKELGVFEVKVQLHPEVDATLKVWVVEE